MGYPENSTVLFTIFATLKNLEKQNLYFFCSGKISFWAIYFKNT